MGTKCSLTARDETGAYSVYCRLDGYPHGEGGVFQRLERLAATYHFDYEADDFVALIVAGWKAGPGDVRLSLGRDAQADVEYHYEISADAKGRIFVEAFQSDFVGIGDDRWTSVAETALYQHMVE